MAVGVDLPHKARRAAVWLERKAVCCRRGGDLVLAVIFGFVPRIATGRFDLAPHLGIGRLCAGLRVYRIVAGRLSAVGKRHLGFGQDKLFGFFVVDERLICGFRYGLGFLAVDNFQPFFDVLDMRNCIERVVEFRALRLVDMVNGGCG
ncbi:hypothetical protein AJ87_06730 [Rhizobium yanglingense]|nr:hypothetical protein AJ87_06730 [Rhizobium yanglingense]